MKRTLALVLLSIAVPASAASLDSFRPYAAGLVDRLVQGAEQLQEAVQKGDLEPAQTAWINARYGWERGETFYAVYFPKLDTKIDSWPDAKQGFHALEVALFKTENLDKAGDLTGALVKAIHTLQDKFADTELTKQGLMNGMAGLAFEIGSAKANGGESPFSETSLKDMQNNMISIETTYYLVFAPELSKKKPKLHKAVVNQLVKLTGALRGDDVDDINPTRVMRLSETLANQFVRAADALGLEQPVIGG